MHSGPLRGRLNDPASFLWRWELAGHPREPAAWRALHEFAATAFPKAGAAFSDLHVSLVEAAVQDDAALATRSAQIEALTQQGRYPSGPVVPAAARAFAAFERGDAGITMQLLEPFIETLERIGGSHAQLDLIRLTLVKACLAAGRPDEARRFWDQRFPHGGGAPVGGFDGMH